MSSLLTEVRIHVSVAWEQANEQLHRFRLRHSRKYRYAWVREMKAFRAECRHNDAIARAVAQFEYQMAYRDAHRAEPLIPASFVSWVDSQK
jgi:hypothetical protein